jgi:hypothetical protein
VGKESLTMPTDRTYGARTIKRHRRSRVEVGAIDEAIVGVLAADHPQSVRHVFYRLTDPRLAGHVAKSEKGYRDVQHRCVQLRRAGRIPYSWIVDATRRGYFVDTFNGRADFVRRMAGHYRADLWAQANCRCEVWVESRSIAGVIHDVCRDLCVSLYPAAGFASLSFIHSAAEEINEEDDGRPLHVLYIGDYDPAGVLIDRKIEQGLRAHINPEVPMTFTRLGITIEQVSTFNLPTKPRKQEDRRAPEVAYTVEAEAMPATTMRAMLRSAIEAMLPPRALEVTRIAEAEERAGLRRIAEILTGRGD